MGLIFRQLFDRETCTYTYVIGDSYSGQAAIVDPVLELVDRDAALLEELGLQLMWALDTHVHADHVTGSGLLRQRTGCKVAVSAAGQVVGADRELVHGDSIRFGLQAIDVRATPGHTASCVTYVLGTEPMAFTGDALMVRGCGRTDFQEGDPHRLFRSVHDQIFSLPDDTQLFPAHDYKGRTVTTVAEERQFNPRLAKPEPEFVQIMNGLGLPRPGRMDIAVPANRRCGDPEEAEAEPRDSC